MGKGKDEKLDIRTHFADVKTKSEPRIRPGNPKGLSLTELDREKRKRGGRRPGESMEKNSRILKRNPGEEAGRRR